MKDTRLVATVAMAVLVAMVQAAAAGGTQARDRAKDQKRDGTCLTTAAASQDRTRDRLRDGSCQTTAAAAASGTRQRMRDGSCQTR